MSTIINTWWFWVIVYLISAILFAQTFKVANKNMKNASALTVLLEIFTGIFSLCMIPIFETKFEVGGNVLWILLIVVGIYAITDRLNIEARYGLETSTFSMLKHLSTVFMIIFGFVFLKEPILLNKIIGAIIILSANFSLAYNKGKLQINKYFLMSVCANFLFAVAMLINVGLSNNFNLAFYTFITVMGPALLISIFSRLTTKKLIDEFKLYDKKYFLVAAAAWCVMLNSSIRAYQLGSVIVVASLFSLTAILNALMEFVIFKNKKNFLKKIIVAILIVLGAILVNL